MRQTSEYLARIEIFSQCSARAKQLGAINLSQGLPEPLMDGPINVALSESTTAGWQYTDPRGMEVLRTAVAGKLYHGRLRAADVLITSGCTESLYIGLRQLSQAYGRRIAFFEPFYPYYLGMADTLGLTPVPIRMLGEAGSFSPDWGALEHHLRQGVRMVLLNTPHNPTGWVLDAAEASLLRSMADRHGAAILIDEAFKHYVYGDVPDSATEQLYADNDRCLVAGSFSKLVSATGLRVGWLLGPAAVTADAYLMHLLTSYCQPPPLQLLLARFLDQGTSPLPAAVVDRYRRKRDLLVDGLRAVGLACAAPAGGHFVLSDYSARDSKIGPDEFSEWFASRYRVMPLPASPFYSPGVRISQVRFSFGVSSEDLQKAVARLRAGGPGT